MSKFPQWRPPMLDYGSGDGNGPRNSVGKFFLRMLVGTFISFAAIGAGLLLLDATNSPILMFLPFIVVLTVMIVITVRKRKFGYITGILLGPFILTALLFMLLLMICGVARFY
jgi:hypothetical protein